MKVTLNLSVWPGARERFALVWAIPTGLIALLVLAYFTLHAVRDFWKYGDVHALLSEQQEREVELQRREKNLKKELDRPQDRQVFREAQFVNTLIDRKQFSLTQLAEKVTKILPPQVRLTSMALAEPGGEPVVRFTIAGNSEEAIETFLGNMEDSSDFRDVAILNQGFEEEGSARGPVHIACTARYVGAKPH